jgi:A/G-specific adenine glycosylase
MTRVHEQVFDTSRDFAPALLGWYDRHHRSLPWRVNPDDRQHGVVPDPYRIWLSEIMLQQTTVAAVKAYFEKFVRLWPDVVALAKAETDDVMKAWAGLGYYSRARNLKKCAEIVAFEQDGRFPEDEAGLKALPGIGDYTAAAIAAIAFDRPAVVVDGNIERVVTRYLACETPLPQAKAEIRDFLSTVLPKDRPGDFAQAMMDLGATVCTPKSPACILCPLSEGCQARMEGTQTRFPLKAPKAEKPERVGAAFVAVRDDGAVLLRKRIESGLLGGMSEVPGTAWTARQDGQTEVGAAPFAADWKRCGEIRQVFTHFALTLTVYRADIDAHPAPDEHWWSPREQIAGEALPSVMKKVVEKAIPGATKARGKATS